MEKPTKFLVLTIAASEGMIVHRRFLIVSVPLFAAHLLNKDSKELLLNSLLWGSGWDCEFGGVAGGSSVGVVVEDDAIARDFRASTLRLSSALIRRVVVMTMEGCCSRQRFAFFPHLGQLV